MPDFRFPLIASLVILMFLAAGQAGSQPSAPLGEPAAQQATVEIKSMEEVQLISPMDGEKLKGFKVNAFASAGTDRDFCQLYAGQSLYNLWITCSQTTGYCGYIEDFGIELPGEVKQKVLSKIKPKYNLGALKPWEKYEITAKIYQWRKKREMDIGNAYLRATYTMRGLPLGPEDRASEKALRKQAIRFIRKAEKKGQIPLREMSTAKYLIGELYRRNEKFGRAVRYFENSLKIKNYPEWLEKWAQEQMAKANADYAD